MDKYKIGNFNKVGFVLTGITAVVAMTPMARVHGAEFQKIEEIMVTARKRVESMQDTPVAVSAFSGGELEARQTDNLAQASGAVPNLTFHPGAPIGGGTSTGSVFIRGIGSNEVTLGTEPGVGLYVDDVYYARSVGSVLDLADIESVQVLRGPQGTLFGRNNVGGAIVVRTNRPTDQFEGSVKLTVGADDRAEALATVNLPITGDLRSRITMLSAQQDGFVNNLDGGDDLGDKDRFAARAVIEWAPSEDMIVTFAADTTRARDSAVPSVLLGLAPTIPGTPFPSDLQAISNLNGACGGGSVLGNSGNPACVDQQYIVGPFDGYGGFVSPHPIFDSQGSHAYQNESKMDLWGASLTFEWDIQSNLTFKSVSAWRDIDSFWPSNSDHSPNPGAEAKNDFDQQQFSQEIQFLGTALDDNLDWVIGAYYLKEEGENLNVVHFPGVIFRSGGIFETEAEAVFAHTTYHFLDDFEFTLGMRYTHEQKQYDTGSFQQIIGVLIDPVNQVFLDFRATPIPFVTGNTPDLNIYELTPQASLAWRVTPELLTYISYSQGYKSGGYEQRLAPGASNAPSFDQETADVYEIGFKASSADRHLVVNGAWFYTDYTDMQISVVDGVAPTLINAGDSTISGAEIEVRWLPTDALSAMFSVGWLDAEYDKLTSRALNSGIQLNNELPNISEWQLHASLAYDFTWSDYGTLTPRFDWSWNSSYFIDSINTPLLEQDDYDLLNVSLTFMPSSERWSLVLSGRNLTNEEILVSGVAQYNIGQIEGQFDRPREWSLSFKVNF